MIRRDISEKVRSFIFEHVDSVEQLEVLLFLRKNSDRPCSAEEITRELRSNLTSVNGRLHVLKLKNLITEENSDFRYNNAKEIEEVLTEVAEEYRVRRTLILELIFSPLKKMRNFADSFVFNSSDKKKGDHDG
ncbi:MAG: hypothetical protein V4596_01665 [Bdellovibrionota bacterium]